MANSMHFTADHRSQIMSLYLSDCIIPDNVLAVVVKVNLSDLSLLRSCQFQLLHCVNAFASKE